MKKRTFLKQSTILIGGAILSPSFSCSPKNQDVDVTPELLKNWAENFEFSTANVAYPETVQEFQDWVKKSEK